MSAAAPSITSLSPNPVPGSYSAQQLTINGSNFASGATLTYHDPQGNSYPGHGTTFVNSSQIIDPAFNNANDGGTWTVIVVNPNGKSSSPFNFTVSAAAPSITSLSPPSYPASSSSQSMLINGNNFVNGAIITFHDPQGNPYVRTPTFVSASQLSYQFNNGKDAGTWTVFVTNPDGRTSNTWSFAVTP